MFKSLFATAAAAALALSLATPAAAQTSRVELKTNRGAIVLELDAAKAPKTVANFLQYVKDGHYSGTVFHRVMDGFMIQGGGFAVGMTEKRGREPIPIESQNGLKNDRGTIAMARTSNPNSATAQFFINVADNAMLNHPQPDGFGYAVFGKVVAGMDVVDTIRKVKTGNHPSGHQNVPLEDIVIQSASILAAK
jgi:peptidyl-prolyl cis-trans isomerase A (cyclophilin A)